ncbi:MAG: hypothetical protein M0P26_02550 [Bacteroidales bacterium]|nr:hypothetical protein [Bacteroidales bacterium]
MAKQTEQVATKPKMTRIKVEKQEAPLITPPSIPSVKNNKETTSKEKINLEHSEILSFDASVNPDYQILTGDVRFRHDGAYLFCDSAHYYMKSNSLYAYGNVHMEQGDSIFLYGAWLYYDGNTKLVMVREKVRLENREVTLFTDSLNYDRISNIGYFFDGGLLVNEDGDVTNELSSEYGQYSPETKMAEFKHDVKLVHPEFIMTNQELKYNTSTGKASIFCPTEIVADSGYVYSENGWYNTKTDKSLLLKPSYILNNHRRLTGDSINYDNKNGIGEAFGNAVLIDSTQQVTLKGNYGYSEEKTNYALMSDSALMIEHSTEDTLFLHADTLMARQDSIYNEVIAFHGVRFFRSDVQGVCDSLYYSTRDSVLSFYYKPILWSEQQQLTGEFMQLYTKNEEPDYLHIQKAAMVISKEGDSLFNQSSGKDLIAYFDSGQVVRVEIKGNAETIYLPHDESNMIIGLNRLEGSSLNLFMEDKKMKKIIVWPQPKGKFYPMEKLPPEDRYLKNFGWYQSIRPVGSEDVFRKIVKTTAFETQKGRLKAKAEAISPIKKDSNK